MPKEINPKQLPEGNNSLLKALSKLASLVQKDVEELAPTPSDNATDATQNDPQQETNPLSDLTDRAKKQ